MNNEKEIACRYKEIVSCLDAVLNDLKSGLKRDPLSRKFLLQPEGRLPKFCAASERHRGDYLLLIRWMMGTHKQKTPCTVVLRKDGLMCCSMAQFRTIPSHRQAEWTFSSRIKALSQNLTELKWTIRSLQAGPWQVSRFENSESFFRFSSSSFALGNSTWTTLSCDQIWRIFTRMICPNLYTTAVDFLPRGVVWMENAYPKDGTDTLRELFCQYRYFLPGVFGELKLSLR